VKDKWKFPLAPVQSLVLVTALVLLCGSALAGELPSFGPATSTTTFLGQFSTIVVGPSTVPSNGDLNPYGVARVPVTAGLLTKGNFLVSNFNNSLNQQGTGTTIVQITPGTDDNGTVTLFAQIDPSLAGCPGGVGLTTALVALRSGLVIVGSLPTLAGDPTTAAAGCLIALDSNGNVVKTFSGHGINGPWDMTALDAGRLVALFVTNVLNNTVSDTSADVSSTPPSPLVLGLALAPDGHILTVNSGDGNIVETTPGGKQVATELLDSSGSPAGAGALFGLVAVWDGVYFVDDATNNFNLFH
jgi:hypothetical protein